MNIRADIQFLRGIAVLLVVLYHAKISFFKGGYMGVDVFFVISGFLITGLIKKGIEANTFSFFGFYYRRAKRLLPAAYTTFATTLVLAYFLLTTQELKDFYVQMVGAITFTANMVLWGQGTYFGVEADLKPLLHTWSLSVEEQYYLIVPAAMFFIPRKFWKPAVLLSFTLSLIFCLIIYSFQHSAAFYLFPARAWELLIGSIGAIYYDKVNQDGSIKYLFWPSLIGIIYLSINPIGGIHPGPDALIICTLTLIVILINNQKPFKNFIAKPIIWVGDISYSLYLIHWPLFAFAANIWISNYEVPLIYRITIVGISLILAYLQYEYIENRFRYNKLKNSKITPYPLITLSIIFISVPSILYVKTVETDNNFIDRMGNTGLGQQCAFYDKFNDSAECRTGIKPSILVWGDSNAMHIVPGLVSVKGNKNFIQATKYVCAPFLGISPIGKESTTAQNKKWAQTCIDFNDSVFNYLKNNDHVDTVIMSSSIDQYLKYSTYGIFDGTKLLTGLSEEDQLNYAVSSMSKTIDKLRSINKKVVFVSPPPALKFDAGRCEDRKQNQLLRTGDHSECIMPYDEILEFRKDVYTFMDEVTRKADINIIRFDQFLVKNDYVMTNIDDTNIFIANAHLSYKGSEILAKRMDLLKLAVEVAN